jgi:6-phosphogluconolactonase
MKNVNRVLSNLLITVSVPLILVAQNSAPQRSRTHYVALIGTYTDKTTSKGIYAADFDAASGQLTIKNVAAETPNPSWVVIHPNGKWAYAANEAGKQSTITAFSIDAQSAKLTQLNQLPALGEDPCYLSLDRTGKFLFVANYSSGTVAVFPILPDGKLGEHTASVKDAGTLGPNKERQEGPHAHWIEVSRNNRFVFVSDLGLDAILSYRFNAAKGTLTPNNPPLAKLTPGAGPRHVAFAPNGKYVYVVSELNSTITAFSYDASQGTLHQFQIISTVPELYTGRNDTAEIAVDPGSKWLFASNRGHDTIAVFAISADGTLRKTGDFSTGGQEPRHFAIDPTGHYLLAENQHSDSINVFRIDPQTGALTQVFQTSNIPSPVCLSFVPSRQ